MRKWSLMVAGAAWALISAVVPGCGANSERVDPDADDSVGGTGVDSADLRATADAMARSLLSSPQLFAKGTPLVVVEPPENRTRFQIDASIFVSDLRAQLMKNAQGRIAFIAREDLKSVLDERERKRAGAVSTPTDASGNPDLAAAPLGTQYFLRGTLQALSKQGDGAVSDYTLATFRIVDAETSLLVWEDKYDWKKIGKSGVIYR